MDDRAIVALYWGRKEEAIRETEKAYGVRLYHLAYGILYSREDAEESVSDTYLATWNQIPPQKPRSLYAFLASICRHISLNRVDWKLAAKRHGEVVALTQEMESCIPDGKWEDRMEGKALKQVLEEFLNSLPRESRLIFLRRYLYVDTIGEIAQRYGIRESKVKTQLHRTRKKLRMYLEKEGIAL